jgi:hypothetical protein
MDKYGCEDNRINKVEVMHDLIIPHSGNENSTSILA